VDKKIELEERKLLVAQRKLESIRLLDELLERVKVNISRLARLLLQSRTRGFCLPSTWAQVVPGSHLDIVIVSSKESGFRFRSK